VQDSPVICRKEQAMLILAGLGNPGNKYAGHRHNIGFMAADEIHRRHNFSPWRSRFQAQCAEGQMAGEKVLLLKPSTFMNESGRSVGEAMRFYKLEPGDVVVIYDELDLPPGKMRMKRGGGAGGHNGIRSLDAHLGKDYRRMRLGIDHPGDKARVTGHVLGDFAKRDHEWLDPLLAVVAENAPLLASGDDSSFMNKVHLALQPDKPDVAVKPKKQSHIRQARALGETNAKPSGPMADMLKKIFKGND
jgi:PTH1 family peptidyl-tRNA hydrolase